MDCNVTKRENTRIIRIFPNLKFTVKGIPFSFRWSRANDVSREGYPMFCSFCVIWWHQLFFLSHQLPVFMWRHHFWSAVCCPVCGNFRYFTKWPQNLPRNSNWLVLVGPRPIPLKEGLHVTLRAAKAFAGPSTLKFFSWWFGWYLLTFSQTRVFLLPCFNVGV